MSCAVLGNDDLLLHILTLARLAPVELVAVERVCQQWRRVYHANAESLLPPATPAVVTKTVLMGMYRLSSCEADSLPRMMRRRRDGGVMYLYTHVAEQAWGVVGGAHEWEARLARRSAYQASIERAFGSEWRRTRWLPYRRPPGSIACC